MSSDDVVIMIMMMRMMVLITHITRNMRKYFVREVNENAK